MYYTNIKSIFTGTSPREWVWFYEIMWAYWEV